jgi:tRNA (guanosine-2'-O-)-methyltransferase
MEKLKGEGYQLIATTPHHDSTMLQDFDISRKTAFFFGKEDVGLSNTVLENADGFLKIPMYGFTESLNISVSAAIILQDVVTRMRRINIDWRLSDEEIRQLEMDWTQRSIKSVEEIIEHYYNNKI